MVLTRYPTYISQRKLTTCLPTRNPFSPPKTHFYSKTPSSRYLIFRERCPYWSDPWIPGLGHKNHKFVLKNRYRSKRKSITVSRWDLSVKIIPNFVFSVGYSRCKVSREWLRVLYSRYNFRNILLIRFALGRTLFRSVGHFFACILEFSQGASFLKF